MRFLSIVLAMLSAGVSATCAASTQAVVDADLQVQLERAVEGFRGRVGIYARQLSTGREARVNADELFPTASLVKVPILLTLYNAIQAGQLDYNASFVFTSSRSYVGGGDVLSSFREGEKVSVPKLAWLTAAYSDNTAALWCQELAGGGVAVNGWLAAHGFENTRVNSKTPGREEAKKAYGWGQTTPREMAALMIGLREGSLISGAAADELYRVLSVSYWNSEALAQIPPWTQVASKQGAVDRSRSEALLVSAPSGDYALVVMTKDQEDQSWLFSNEGFQLLRRVSALVWKHFEPACAWKPAEGWQKFYKEDS